MATKSKEIYRKYEDGSLKRVGYLPTEDVSSRVDNVEFSLKDEYITKNEANSSFAGSAATKEALDGLNEATSNNATAINNIKSTLAGMNSFDYVVTSLPLPEASADTMYKIYLIKDDHTDSEDTFDEYITVSPTSETYQWEKIGNTDLDLTPYAKTDYVIDNFVGNSDFEQYKDGLQHETNGLANRVAANESSISNLNNAVADRYTKAETDGKLDEKLSIITSHAKYIFEGNGEHRFCKIATITATQSWVNRPIVFECIGRGMNSQQIISIYPSGNPEPTETTFTNITKTTNDLVWALKDEGNGVCSLYVMLSEVWGNVEVVRVSYDGFYVNVEMKMEGCDGFPEGSIAAKNIITALSADTATTANTATLANSLSMPRDESYNPDNYSNNSEAKVVGKETSQGASIGGLGYAWWHIFNNLSIDGRFSTQLALRLYDGIGSVEQTPYLAFRNHTTRGWSDWAVAITDKTIGQQTVKSFTATEVDHGCKFNGDLSSTTCSSAPMMVTTGKLTVSSANEPNATKTTKTKEIRMDNTMKTITCPMNPFMEYFFDHGYHFDNGEEGNGSEYDVGIVAYSNRIYYCVFRYVDEVDNDFTASPLETNDDTENSKFLFKTDGVATGLILDDNKIRGGNGNVLKFPNKDGVIATTLDLPIITDSLTETHSGYVLSAKGANTLQSHIDSIKFSESKTRVNVGAIGANQSTNEPMLVHATSISGGTYGTFYTIWGAENGYNRDYGVLAVMSTSDSPSMMTGTNTVSLVSGENGYWGAQWLSLSVFVPANKTYYIFGCRVTSVRYSYVRLSH